MRSRSIAAFAAVSLTVFAAGCGRHKQTVVQPQPTGPAVVEQLVAAGAGQALTRVTSDPVDEFVPTLSVDNLLLFVAVTYDAGGNVAQQVLVGTNPSTGASRTIYTSATSKAGSPAWTPDGKSFLFMSNGMGSWNLVRSLSKAPNAAVTVVDRADVAQGLDHPAVAPDGKRVAFQMNANGTNYIGVSGMDGSNFTQLTEGSWPSWSPDGKSLAFFRKVGATYQLFLVNPDTGTDLVQVTNDQSSNENPAWTIDGKHIVFQSNRGWDRFHTGSADHTWNLYAIKPDGTGLTQITDGPKDTGQPFCGKDGWIYFASNESGNFDIWRIKVVGELAPSGT